MNHSGRLTRKTASFKAAFVRLLFAAKELKVQQVQFTSSHFFRRLKKCSQAHKAKGFIGRLGLRPNEELIFTVCGLVLLVLQFTLVTLV